jgi:type IV pilus assembly protein PilQ
MHLRHLVISSLAALSLGVPGEGLFAADSGTNAPGDQGQLITLETSDKPLETVLQWISRRAMVNIVCNEAEQPRITLRLVNVTWQEAIEQIASRYDLVIEKHSDRVWQLTRPPKVRMEFQDARLTVILEALARQANVNIVISDDVDANRRLTMTLNGVPWREALDVIVRATGYAWVEQEYSIVRVVSPDKLQKDLHTKIFHLNYTTAADLAKVVTATMSADGKVITDLRSNSLILTDTPLSLESVTKIIAALDSRTREVQLEMRFVTFSNSDSQSLGFDPINASFNLKGIGNLAASFTPTSPTFGGGLNFANNGGTAGAPPNNPSSSGQFSADFTFEALSQLESTEILQAPQILTLDNQPAKILIGTEIHYAQTTITQNPNGSGSLITLQEASTSPVHDGITINVTPHITSDGFVSIDLSVTNDLNSFVTYTNGQNVNSSNYATIQLPTLSKTEVKTSIMVADSKTAVIGGILNNEADETNYQVPLLGSIPGLGWLFKKRISSVTQRNLTIFITPRIIQTTQERSEYEENKLRVRERLSGLNLHPTTGEPNRTLGSEP